MTMLDDLVGFVVTLGSCATSDDYPRLAAVEAMPTLHLTKHPLPHILVFTFVSFVSFVVKSFGCVSNEL